MERSEIEKKLKEILFNTLEEEAEVSDDTDLIKDLALNSISLLYMALDIESAFGIKMENAEIAGISTIGQWISYIEGKIKD